MSFYEASARTAIFGLCQIYNPKHAISLINLKYSLFLSGFLQIHHGLTNSIVGLLNRPAVVFPKIKQKQELIYKCYYDVSGQTTQTLRFTL